MKKCPNGKPVIVFIAEIVVFIAIISAIVVAIAIGSYRAFNKKEKATGTETTTEIEPTTQITTQIELETETETEIQTETFTTVEKLQSVSKTPETSTECVTTPAFEGYDFIPLDKSLQIEIYNLCEEYSISYELIISVIATESNFNVSAIGDNGDAIGLMQIQPRWWQELADSEGLDVYNPTDNVELGIIILVNAIKDNEGELIKALKQYRI